MKILLVTKNYGGGAGIACRRLHAAFIKHGFNSTLLVLDKVHFPKEINVVSIEEIIAKKYGVWYFWLLKLINIFLTKLPVGFKRSAYINGPYSIFRIDKLDIFKDSDIIHLHWVPKMISWKHVFADKTKSFVWTLHDMNPFTGGNHYTSDYNYSLFEELLQKNVLKKRQYIQHCNLAIISPSYWLANLAKESEVFKDFDVYTIPNCIDTSVFKPLDKKIERSGLDITLNKRIMLFVAENPDDKRKGMDILLKALNGLKNTDNVCLLVIGKVIEINNPSIEVKQLGYITDERTLVSAYNAADFFVIPSIEDNLPNTVVESLSCGTPVLGFNIGGMPEMIKNNEMGMLADLGNEDAFIRNINQFLGITDFASYSTQSRALAEELFSEKNILEKNIAVYAVRHSLFFVS